MYFYRECIYIIKFSFGFAINMSFELSYRSTNMSLSFIYLLHKCFNYACDTKCDLFYSCCYFCYILYNFLSENSLLWLMFIVYNNRRKINVLVSCILVTSVIFYLLSQQTKYT